MEKMPLDVLIINPPFSRLKGVYYDVFFPIGSGYLAAALRNICAVKIYNAEDPMSDTSKESMGRLSFRRRHYYHDLFMAFDNYKRAIEQESLPVWDEIKEIFQICQPRIIGVSCMSAQYPSALKIGRIYKTLFPEGVVIFGGQHPTLRTEEVLLTGGVDFVIRGEGEETIAELVSDLLAGNVAFNRLERIKGISFLRGGAICHTENRITIKNLDKLSFPARDLMVKPIRNASAYGVIIRSGFIRHPK